MQGTLLKKYDFGLRILTTDNRKVHTVVSVRAVALTNALAEFWHNKVRSIPEIQSYEIASIEILNIPTLQKL